MVETAAIVPVVLMCAFVAYEIMQYLKGYFDAWFDRAPGEQLAETRKRGSARQAELKEARQHLFGSRRATALMDILTLAYLCAATWLFSTQSGVGSAALFGNALFGTLITWRYASAKCRNVRLRVRDRIWLRIGCGIAWPLYVVRSRRE